MTVKDFSMLTDLSSKGLIKEYYIWVESNDDGTACIQTRWGYKDGKHQEKSKVISVGKSLGKKNETTPYQQACKEAKSTWQKKVDSGYKPEGEEVVQGESTGFPLPMLAHTYSKRKHNIVWPAMTQPKLDGMRIVAFKAVDGNIYYGSKTGKPIRTTGHWYDELNIYMRTGEIWDGEIYIHGMPVQDIISLAKSPKKDTTALEFWVFDILSEGTNLERMHSLMSRGLALYTDEKTTSQIKLVVATSAINEDFAMLQHDSYVLNGFEGLIIRNLEGLYKVKHRSTDLQKHKNFIDAEFEIIGGFADADGGIVYTCKIASGATFGVRPKGTLIIRQEAHTNLSTVIGKPLTVRYQNLSPDEIPIFPVGIMVRDYE